MRAISKENLTKTSQETFTSKYTDSIDIKLTIEERETYHSSVSFFIAII
jgi:hypothetical protein